MGWQPDYPGEAKVYAKYILSNKPSAKIGVLYQNDAYGKNYLDGLKNGLGSHANQIVDAESYNVSDSAQVIGDARRGPEGARSRHVRDLRDAGADDPGARREDV